MFAAVPMLQMGMARKLVVICLKYCSSMDKVLIVTISVVALTIGWGEGTGLQMFHDFLMQEWCKGMLDDLCCLGATTSKHGGELAVREHGLAESGEAMCNLCNHAGRECCVLP